MVKSSQETFSSYGRQTAKSPVATARRRKTAREKEMNLPRVRSDSKVVREKSIVSYSKLQIPDLISLFESESISARGTTFRPMIRRGFHPRTLKLNCKTFSLNFKLSLG